MEIADVRKLRRMDDIGYAQGGSPYSTATRLPISSSAAAYGRPASAVYSSVPFPSMYEMNAAVKPDVASKSASRMPGSRAKKAADETPSNSLLWLDRRSETPVGVVRLPCSNASKVPARTANRASRAISRFSSSNASRRSCLDRWRSALLSSRAAERCERLVIRVCTCVKTDPSVNEPSGTKIVAHDVIPATIDRLGLLMAQV